MSEELNRLNEISGFFRRMNTKVKLLTLITKAKEEYDRYDYKSGIETLEEAFKIDPQNPTVLRGLGCMKQFSGDYDTAIEFYRKALEFSEAQEVEYTLIGMAYYLQDKLDEAVENFNLAIDKNDNYTQAYEGRNQAMLENHVKILDLQESLKNTSKFKHQSISNAHIYPCNLIWAKNILILLWKGVFFMQIKILLVEDQKLMRIGIKSLFSDYPDLEIIGEAVNGKEAIEKSRLIKPDIVLMDIGLPDISGIEAAKQILEHNNNIKVIMLTSHISEEELNASLSAGASAYVIKDISTDFLMSVIKMIKEGAMWIDPHVVPFIRDKNSGVIPSRQLSRSAFKENHSNLTQREYEVLKLVVDGQSNSQIAKTLTISEHTAKAHVCNIIQKLVVDDRTQAAVKALKEGLV